MSFLEWIFLDLIPCAMSIRPPGNPTEGGLPVDSIGNYDNLADKLFNI